MGISRGRRNRVARKVGDGERREGCRREDNGRPVSLVAKLLGKAAGKDVRPRGMHERRQHRRVYQCEKER